jgi:hypothetical protein
VSIGCIELTGRDEVFIPPHEAKIFGGKRGFSPLDYLSTDRAQHFRDEHVVAKSIKRELRIVRVECFGFESESCRTRGENGFWSGHGGTEKSEHLKSLQNYR